MLPSDPPPGVSSGPPADVSSAPPRAAARNPWPLLISALLLAGLLYGFNGWSLLGDVAWPPLVLAVLLALLLDTGVGALKWWWILQRLAQPLSFVTVWQIWTGLLPLTFFAPFQSGHALYPVALSRAAGVDPVVATVSVIYDKSLSLVSTFALIAVGQALLPSGHPLVHWWISVVALAGVSLWFFDRPVRAVLAFVSRFFPGIAVQSRDVRRPLPLPDKVGLLLVGMVYQSSDSLSIWLGAMALGLDLPATLAFGAYPLALLASYVPLTFAGIGLREPATALALGSALSWDEGLVGGVLVDGLEYLAPAVFGLTCLPWLLRRLRAG